MEAACLSIIAINCPGRFIPEATGDSHTEAVRLLDFHAERWSRSDAGIWNRAVTRYSIVPRRHQEFCHQETVAG